MLLEFVDYIFSMDIGICLNVLGVVGVFVDIYEVVVGFSVWFMCIVV